MTFNYRIDFRRTTVILLGGIAIVLLVFLGRLPAPVRAQQTSDGPVYIVQEGDSLWDIAARFGVSLDELKSANNLNDGDQLAVGARLVIPGLEGVQGVLITREIEPGETLRSLSRRYGVAEASLARLNHMTSPAEFFAGASLILNEPEEETSSMKRVSLAPGETLLEAAVLAGANPWSIATTNHLDGPVNALPGDVLLVPASSAQSDVGGQPDGLPGEIRTLAITPTLLTQGQAVSIRLSGPEGTELEGSLAGNELHFFPDQKGGYVAIQGIHAMLDPGIYPLDIRGRLPNEKGFSFSQSVYVRSGQYPYDPALTVSSETIDPAVTVPEDAEWKALASGFTPEKLWQGKFQSPVPEIYSECWPSGFGHRRSYNGSAYEYFHTGQDFCGGVGTDIYAPADGVVVFAGPLTVRGNATMIDHGWGVFSGYMHQSELLVKVGDKVKAGQLIGKVGGTGRVTGPHLHWEIFAGGVQVNPLDWLQREFP